VFQLQILQIARKPYRSRLPKILQTHTQSIRRKSCVCLPKGDDEDVLFRAHRMLQRKGLDQATEEEAVSAEGIAQSKAKTPSIQCKQGVFTLQLADIQTELQCH
jgi:hypothetical protein